MEEVRAAQHDDQEGGRNTAKTRLDKNLQKMHATVEGRGKSREDREEEERRQKIEDKIIKGLLSCT